VLGSGSVLSDRYRLDDRVATGGMGDVWRATDLVLGRQIAVKVLLPSLVTDPSFIARFRAEARMMAALHHPGIVQVYDCGTDTSDDRHADYLVMEFVNGEPLSHRIDAAGRLGVEETLSVVTQAAQALHAAHVAGIVHRDVKPSNLLVQPDGTVVLVDFGVARSTSATSVTSTNAVPGTVLYMSPEQASGKPVTAATDVYALGAVAYCCLTGHPPFTGDNPLEVAVRHLHDDPPELPADVPGPVAALVMRMLAKDPAQRHPSAAALADAARAAATGSTPADTTAPVAFAAGAAFGAVRPGPSTLADMPAVPASAGPPRRGHNRRAAVAGAVAVVVLAVAGLTAALAFQAGDDPRGNQPSTTSTTPGGAPTTGPTARDGDQLPTTRRTGNSTGGGAGPSAGTASNTPAATPSSTGSPAPSSEPSHSPPASDPTPETSATGVPAEGASATAAAAG
jgi:hypothetical protein